MSLTETINDKITESIKARDSFMADLFRMTKSALSNAAIAKSDHILTEADEIDVIMREVKKRQQAVELYNQGHRPELAAKEQREVEVLQQFLPKQSSDEEIEKVISTAITEIGAKTAEDAGKVMGKVMPQLKGKADSGRIMAIIKQKLA